MIKNKIEIRNFIYEYMDCTTNNPEKALGFIKYYTFDKNRINKDRDKIFKFFIDNFNLDENFILYNTMLKDKNGHKWLEIKDIYDVLLLDELLAFAIASGVFMEDLSLRLEYNPHIKVLFEEPEELKCYTEQEYLHIIKNKIINSLHMHVNLAKIKEYKSRVSDNRICEFGDEERRDLLLYWWDKTIDSDDFTDERKKFIELLNSEYLNFLSNFIVGCNMTGRYASVIGDLIKKGELIPIIQIFNAHILGIPRMKDSYNKAEKELLQKLYKESQKKKRLG